MFVRIVTATIFAAALVGGGLGSARAGQALSDSYESPTYGYTLSWDTEFWTPVNEVSEDGVDSLVLRLGEGVGNVFLTGLPSAQLPDDCVDGIASARANSGDYPGFSRVTGRATPQAGPGGAGDLFGYVLETSSGDDVPLVQYIECRPLIPGEAVLVIILEVIDEPSLYEAALVLYADLISTLQIPSAEGETPRDPDEDEDETGTSGQDQDDEEEPASQGRSGVEGNQYTSPNFGFTIVWDPAVWEVTDESSEDGADYFEVTTLDGTSLVGFESVLGYGGDASLCRDDASSLLEDTEGITAFTPTPHVNTGEPLIGGDRSLAFAIYDATYTDGQSTLRARVYLQCRTLVAQQAVLAVLWIVPVELFNTDLAAFEDLLLGLDTSDAEVRATSDSPTPSEDETEVETDEDQDDPVDPEDQQDSNDQEETGEEEDDRPEPDNDDSGSNGDSDASSDGKHAQEVRD